MATCWQSVSDSLQLVQIGLRLFGDKFPLLSSCNASVFAEVECSSSCVDQRFRVLRSEPYSISPFLSTSNLLTYCQLSDYTALYVPLMKNTICRHLHPLIDFRRLLCSLF